MLANKTNTLTTTCLSTDKYKRLNDSHIVIFKHTQMYPHRYIDNLIEIKKRKLQFFQNSI